MIFDSTICAISTAPGTGGIAVIRLSGRDAITIADQVFHPVSKKMLAHHSANTLHFGAIRDNELLLDEVVVSLFKAPHSYTGEDVVEFSCHGSLFIQQQLLQLLLQKGAVLAQPGEFTQRAYLNGKMDLSQAEAVADLIASTSASAHRVAINQMRGGYSAEIAALRERLLHFTTLVELELDFSEEDVEFADRRELIALSENMKMRIDKLISSFRLGNAIRNGIPVAIVGETNVGKSTLLNALLKEEKAIVSDIHGTTRDVIEDVINLDGVTFRFFDTAGLRSTTDVIETIGIQRSYQKLEQAAVVLVVADGTGPAEKVELLLNDLYGRIDGQELILVVNKLDLMSSEQIDEYTKMSRQRELDCCLISARTQHNIEELIQRLLRFGRMNELTAEDVIVSNVRHLEALQKSSEAIVRTLNSLKEGVSGEFLSQDIRECIYYLGTISGEITSNEVLGNIFKNFCIGK